MNKYFFAAILLVVSILTLTTKDAGDVDIVGSAEEQILESQSAGIVEAYEVTLLREEVITSPKIIIVDEQNNPILEPQILGSGRRLIVFAKGFVPLAITKPYSLSKDLHIKVPYAGSLRFSLSGEVLQPGEASLSYMFNGITMPRSITFWNKGVLHNNYSGKISFAEAVELPAVKNWLNEDVNNNSSMTVMLPLFALPTTAPLETGNDLLISRLPAKMKVFWQVSPSTIQTSEENNPIVIVAGSEHTITLESSVGCAIKGRLVPPSKLTAGNFDGDFFVELSQIFRNNFGHLAEVRQVAKVAGTDNGDFEVTELLPGEYQLLGKYIADDSLVLFNWVGELEEGSSLDLGDLLVHSTSVVHVRVGAVDISGISYESEQVWLDHNYPSLEISYKRKPDLLSGPFGNVTIECGKALNVYGLEAGEWAFSASDRSSQSIKPVNGFTRKPYGSQTVKIVLPDVQDVEFKVGVMHGQESAIDITGLPNSRRNNYRLKIFSMLNHRLLVDNSVYAANASSKVNQQTAFIAPGRYWAAICEDNPLPFDETRELAASFFGEIVIHEDGITKIAMAPHQGVKGRVRPGENDVQPRALPISIIHNGKGLLFEPITFQTRIMADGSFHIPGVPPNSKLSIDSHWGEIVLQEDGYIEIVAK